ncbi:MAG: DUF4198 domain-containing protein [Verrucomicrobia bacterium]|nr:DUF4198 domain-containing protein [Verrucomicrobiota bacterium]
MNTERSQTRGGGRRPAAGKFAAGLALGLTLLVAAAPAHDTWLQPDRSETTPGATFLVDLSSADGFTGFQTAIQPERVAKAVGRLGGAALVVGAGTATEKTLRFPVTVMRPGVAVMGVELKPRLLELEPDKIETYFREIHAGEELREQWAAVPEPRRWRESYVKHAKSFVRVGEPAAGDRAWAEPLGLGLEIVPERDPTTLRAGEALPVRVLRGGRPLAGFVLAYVSAGETHEHVVMTDAEGRASATLAVRGAWLVHGTDLRRATVPDREWESDFTTMTVDVK